MKFRSFALAASIILLGSSLISGQQDADPMARHLFPPELVMAHQQAIGLTEEQRTFIKGEVQRVTGRFTEIQWEIQREMELLQSLIKEGSIDEQRSLQHLDRLLDLEREVKRLHLTLAIRIKNKLTPDQQGQLQALRTSSRQK